MAMPRFVPPLWPRSGVETLPCAFAKTPVAQWQVVRACCGGDIRTLQGSGQERGPTSSRAFESAILCFSLSLFAICHKVEGEGVIFQ